MSCPSYLNETKTDVISCQGMKPSNIIPNHEISSEERKCLGIDIGLMEWNDNWKTGTCSAVFKDMIYPDGEYSEVGFRNVVDDYNYIFYSYYGPYDAITNRKGGHFISSSDKMSTYLINSCSDNQGVCQCVSYNMCSECKSSDVYSDDLIRKLCGCYCSNSISQLYGVDKECEATCANATTSKQRNYQTGIIKGCKKKVCFLESDQIFTFNDSCPHCNNNDCECIISGEHPEIFSENCVDSQKINDETDSYSSGFWFIIIIILIMFGFAIIITVLKNPKISSDQIKVESTDNITPLTPKLKQSLSNETPISEINPSYSVPLKAQTLNSFNTDKFKVKTLNDFDLN
jgi:hypothetical protein